MKDPYMQVEGLECEEKKLTGCMQWSNYFVVMYSCCYFVDDLIPAIPIESVSELHDDNENPNSRNSHCNLITLFLEEERSSYIVHF